MSASVACSPAAVLAWAVDWGATLALLEAPDGPPGVGADGIALVAKREAVCLAFDEADASAWAGIAAQAVATGTPRWVASIVAVEALIIPATRRPGVRARHLAAIRAAIGASADA